MDLRSRRASTGCGAPFSFDLSGAVEGVLEPAIHSDNDRRLGPVLASRGAPLRVAVQPEGQGPYRVGFPRIMPRSDSDHAPIRRAHPVAGFPIRTLWQHRTAVQQEPVFRVEFAGSRRFAGDSRLVSGNPEPATADVVSRVPDPRSCPDPARSCLDIEIMPRYRKTASRNCRSPPLSSRRRTTRRSSFSMRLIPCYGIVRAPCKVGGSAKGRDAHLDGESPVAVRLHHQIRRSAP